MIVNTTIRIEETNTGFSFLNRELQVWHRKKLNSKVLKNLSPTCLRDFLMFDDPH
jgi:hypothetical protein